jgi:hypothetical protein
MLTLPLLKEKPNLLEEDQVAHPAGQAATQAIATGRS